jgi:hypothetical protein
MCKSRMTAQGEECYAVGLQRSARFKTPSIAQESAESSEEEEEEEQESEEGDEMDSSEEDGGLSSSEEDDGVDGVTVSYDERNDDAVILNSSDEEVDEENGDRRFKRAVTAQPSLTNNFPNHIDLANTTRAHQSTAAILSSTPSTTTQEPPHRKEPLRKPLPKFRHTKLHKVMNNTFLIFRGER